MRFWLYFPLWIFFGDEVINLSLSLGSSPSGPSGWKAHSSSLVLTCPHFHTWHQALCGCVCVCVCVCVCASTHACTLSKLWYFVTPLAVACQTPLSMEFSRQEYWNRWSFLSPGDHPNPGIKPMSFVSPALAGRFFTNWATGKPLQKAMVTLKYVSTIWSNCFQICLWCWDISDM